MDNSAVSLAQKTANAEEFMENARQRFEEQPSAFNEFLDLMKDFKAQTVDTDFVMRRVWELFRGHADLVIGFNEFLPPGYKFTITTDSTTGNVQGGFESPSGFRELPSHQNLSSSSNGPGSSTQNES